MLTIDSNKAQLHKEREAVEKTKEMLVNAEAADVKREAVPFTPDAGRDVTAPEQQMGRPMPVNQVMKLLNKMNSNLHFEVSRSDRTKMGIYLLTVYQLPGMSRQSDKMFICGMENGVMPEYSIMEAEVKSIPDPEAPDGVRWVPSFKRETRGWKTVLAILLKKFLVTPYQCDRYFQTELGHQSGRWHEFMTSPIEIISESTGDTHGT